MYSSDTNHEKVEISLMQILSAGIIVMVALVLPAQQIYTEQQAAIATQTTLASGQTITTNTFSSSSTISAASNTENTTANGGNSAPSGSITTPSSQNSDNLEGRVAGATTRASLITIPIINVTIDMSNQSQLLYLVGGALIIFSLLLLFLASEPKKQEMKLPPHWR